MAKEPKTVHVWMPDGRSLCDRSARPVGRDIGASQMPGSTSLRKSRQPHRPDDLKEETAASLPVRRTGKPDDVAHAVSFFAGEWTGFITGQVLYVETSRSAALQYH